jgi:3-deoxy-D-manno-octulosonate 8-phosphate phosphatase (KDO 8-P phosphatase)
LICDVDGVLTDGGILLADDGTEIKQFNAHDGAGIHLLVQAGFQVAFLTGRESGAVSRRARELGVQHVRQGATDKVPVYEGLLAAMGVSDAEVCYVGDDLPDLPPMRRAGYSAAPADAREEVRAAASYVTHAPGGRGAVREVIERILKTQGKWAGILSRYSS